MDAIAYLSGGSYVPHSLTLKVFVGVGDYGVKIGEARCFSVAIQHTDNVVVVSKIKSPWILRSFPFGFHRWCCKSRGGEPVGLLLVDFVDNRRTQRMTDQSFNFGGLLKASPSHPYTFVCCERF